MTEKDTAAPAAPAARRGSRRRRPDYKADEAAAKKAVATHRPGGRPKSHQNPVFLSPEYDQGSPAERLAKLEALISAAQSAAETSLIVAHNEFVMQAGPALIKIKEDDLWQAGGYTSFKDYFEKKWKYTEQRAYQLIRAVPVIAALKGVATVKINEGQCRELAPVARDHDAATVQKIWRAAESKGKVTAKALAAARDELNIKVAVDDAERTVPRSRKAPAPAPVDPVRRLAGYVGHVETFAQQVQGLADAYADAAKKDAPAAEKLLAEIRGHMAAAAAAFPQQPPSD
ncbi:hypothetical protein OG440_41570 (plasmid) [Streptomyces sp. NBC_00637]|uniref:hypothetical protein n=1 Tax=Streptomyces sp. NBC_00637 TaxID=2903667 RepID=UPI002F90BC10